MNFSDKIFSDVESRLKQLKEVAESGKKFEKNFWDHFVESEEQLISLMNDQAVGPDAKGSIESSWVLYFLNHDIPFTFIWMEGVLKLLGLPASKIEPQDWKKWKNELKTEGVTMGDGSLVNTTKYAILDDGWTLALLDYFLLKLDIIRYAPFRNTPTIIKAPVALKARIAILGDCGSGKYTDGNLPASPSQLVLQQIALKNPDAIIHLGDVYYSGSKNEEQDKLINCWPENIKMSFTMNSNHEMYHGANGLYKIALDPYGPFAAQQQTTYFQLEMGNWIIIGLDSAYYDKSSLFMDGAITDPNQVAFLKNAALQPGKKIMILTHHVGLDTQGSNTTSLWNDVVGTLGRQPDYWYWGHVHNGIVYSDKAGGGNITCRCRCCGHAAIPFGKADWLNTDKNSPDYNPNITYVANTPLDNPTPDQLLRFKNGFAILDFTTDGVTETWYDQDGNLAWSSN